jgi:hypothetical protein
MDKVLTRHPVVDVKTGLVTPEWHKWFEQQQSPAALQTVVREVVTNVFAGGGAPAISWTTLDKGGSSLADLSVRNASDLTGPLGWDQLPQGAGTWPATIRLSGDVTLDRAVVAGPYVRPEHPNTTALGTEQYRFSKVHAHEIATETLVALERVAMIGGSVLVAWTSYLVAPVLPTHDTIAVEHNAFDPDDLIRLAARGQVEWMQIVDGPFGSGPYSYTVTRGLGTGGSAQTWLAGDAAVSTGDVGDGVVEMFAETGLNGGIGPAVLGWVRTGTDPEDLEPRWAVGNLNGVYDYVDDVYGLAAGDPAAAWIKAEDVNGVRLGFGAETIVHISGVDSSTFERGITIGPAGSVTAGGVRLDADGLLLGDAGAIAAYDSSSAVKFQRETAFGLFGAPGDVFALFNTSAPSGGSATLHELTLQNTVVSSGSGGYDGDAHVWLIADGWDGGGAGAPTTRASVEVRSTKLANGVYITGAARLSGALYDYGRTTPQGTWLPRTPFAAGNYIGSSGTFTVASGDVIADTYMRDGKTMAFCCGVINASITGATPAYLMIVLPLGVTVDKRTEVPAVIRANGTYELGEAIAVPGETFVRVYRAGAGYAAWPLSAANVEVRFTIPVSIV